MAFFGHREHLELAWSRVRDEGMPAAGDSIGAFARGVAASEGAPDRHHEAVTQFWARLIAFAVGTHPDSAEARRGWLEPDLAPLP